MQRQCHLEAIFLWVRDPDMGPVCVVSCEAAGLGLLVGPRPVEIHVVPAHNNNIQGRSRAMVSCRRGGVGQE